MFKLEEIDPKSLQLAPNDWNTNVVSPDNEKKLQESIKRLGFFKPIVVRTLENGTLEIIGGEHRWQAAIALGYTKIPIVNLGPVTDKVAKEISIVDNGRYGADDTLQLQQLLESLGPVGELSSFMPYETDELEHIFSSVNAALDSLEIDEKEETPPPMPPQRKVQEFQMMRFKVPVGDAPKIQDRIERIMRENKLTEDDSLTNAGMALVILCGEDK